jgi:hypothetical protein
MPEQVFLPEEQGDGVGEEIKYHLTVFTEGLAFMEST